MRWVPLKVLGASRLVPLFKQLFLYDYKSPLKWRNTCSLNFVLSGLTEFGNIQNIIQEAFKKEYLLGLCYKPMVAPIMFIQFAGHHTLTCYYHNHKLYQLFTAYETPVRILQIGQLEGENVKIYIIVHPILNLPASWWLKNVLTASYCI